MVATSQIRSVGAHHRIIVGVHSGVTAHLLEAEGNLLLVLVGLVICPTHLVLTECISSHAHRVLRFLPELQSSLAASCTCRCIWAGACLPSAHDKRVGALLLATRELVLLAGAERWLVSREWRCEIVLHIDYYF